MTESVVDAFDPDPLDTFCELQLGFLSADITDTLLTADIKSIVASVKIDTLLDIKDSFKRELKLDMAESDAKARYINNFKMFKRSR